MLEVGLVVHADQLVLEGLVRVASWWTLQESRDPVSCLLWQGLQKNYLNAVSPKLGKLD